jgi:hypothetical protein
MNDMCNHREKVLVRFSRLQIEAWKEFVSGILGCKAVFGDSAVWVLHSWGRIANEDLALAL